MNVFDKWVYINLVFISWGSSTGERAFDLGLSSPSTFLHRLSGLSWWLSNKESACDAGAARDPGLIPGSGRSSGGGHGNPLQYSCPENPTDRRAWRATVHRVTKRWTWLKQLSTHAHFDKSLSISRLISSTGKREISLILNVKALSNCRV